MRRTRRSSKRRYRKSSKRRYRSSKRRYKKSRRYRARRKTRRTRRYRKSSKRRYRSSKRRYSKKRRTRRTRRKYTRKTRRTYRSKRRVSRSTLAKRKRNMRLKRIRLAKAKKARRSRVRRSYKRQPRIYSSQPSKSFISQETAPMYQSQQVDGDVSMEVIGPAVGETRTQGRNKTVGGVSTTTLRRTVIDRMIQENGWVENDYSKQIGDKKVYVVIAKSAGKNNRVQSRTFYFTESNGQIYRVSSKAQKDQSEQVVKKSENMIKSLQKPAEQRTQTAKNQ